MPSAPPKDRPIVALAPCSALAALSEILPADLLLVDVPQGGLTGLVGAAVPAEGVEAMA